MKFRNAAPSIASRTERRLLRGFSEWEMGSSVLVEPGESASVRRRGGEHLQPWLESSEAGAGPAAVSASRAAPADVRPALGGPLLRQREHGRAAEHLRAELLGVGPEQSP